MATFYIVRRGWNAANQSSMGRPSKPADTFQSGLDALVAIVEAGSAEDAIGSVLDRVPVYNNQSLTAYTNPRKLKGLTRAIREYSMVY